MNQLAVYVFCASGLFIVYVLFGYPLVLALLSGRGGRPVRRGWVSQTVSIVIPIQNGRTWIGDKLQTISELDYPEHLLDVIFVDDGSTDGTAEFIRQKAPTRYKVLTIARGGKAIALNAGIAAATGDILFFTDIRQRLDSQSLKNLIGNFADESVGVASGELIILSGETQQEADIGLYWRYEKWIRARLSMIDSVLGATGCIYAMRRELAGALPPNTLLDDVHLPLQAFFKGYRIVFDEAAKAFDYPTALTSEFRRKVRTQAGVYQIVAAFPRLLLPTTRMWFHFVSHKVSRLLLPHALIVFGLSTLALPNPWKRLCIGLQVAFYGLAMLDGRIPQGWRIKRASSIARTFVILVASALCAPLFLASNHRRLSGWRTTEVRPVVVRSDR
jgi:cellulose synthase/poly-beta-1,6-N-acetylglucosamine synthase-like glycosyltransferase